jgi:hypothetical protein
VELRKSNQFKTDEEVSFDFNQFTPESNKMAFFGGDSYQASNFNINNHSNVANNGPIAFTPKQSGEKNQSSIEDITMR